MFSKQLLAGVGFGLTLITGHAAQWLTYEPKSPGNGKHIVLLAGDEEYRSEEASPMLAKILSQRYGFKCTVLFSQDPDGTINPNNSTNVPGMHHLATADLAILQFRFRELPDADMKHFVDYVQAGKPLIAIRTATHAFQYSRNPKSPYAKWDWRNKDWPGGFGQQVLGDTWVSHHGGHNKESARGLINGAHANHPVLKDVGTVWGPTDVYGIVKLKPDDKVLMHGQVLRGMKPDDPPNSDKALMPLVWLRDYKWENGNTTRSLTSTIGAAVDLQDENLRRLFVNACHWLCKLDVPAKADVAFVGDFKPTYFGFNGFKKNVKVDDHSAN